MNSVTHHQLATRAGANNVAQLILSFADQLPARIYYRDWKKDVRWVRREEASEQTLHTACFLMGKHIKLIEATIQEREQLQAAQHRLVEQNFHRLLMDGYDLNGILVAEVDYLTVSDVMKIRERYNQTLWICYKRLPGDRLLIMGGDKRKWFFSDVAADGFTAVCDDPYTIYYKPRV